MFRCRVEKDLLDFDSASRPTFENAGDLGHTPSIPSPSSFSIGYPEWGFII